MEIGFQPRDHEKERKSDILNLISFLFLYEFLRDQRYHNSTKCPTAVDHHIKSFSFSSWNKHLMNLIGGDLTNELLRRGHHIVQVRPDRKNKIKTIFLFDGTEELKEDLFNIAREERIALKKELFA